MEDRCAGLGHRKDDFDLAPGPMHVEEDEQVGRTVALVLAIVALDLARLGRDRLADLADELGRALVETDDRVLRIGRFGIEVEHILHAGDVFGIDLRNTPHVLAPGLEVVFGQTPAHGLAGETVMCGELDQFTRARSPTTFIIIGWSWQRYLPGRPPLDAARAKLRPRPSR